MIIMCALCYFTSDMTYSQKCSVLSLKVLLAIIGFFIIFYVVMVMILMAG